MHRRQMRTPGPWWMRRHHQQWREKLPLKLQPQSMDNKDEPVDTDVYAGLSAKEKKSF
jgi:hypothetical protein